LAVILALQGVPPYKSITISTRSEYTIRSAVYYGAGNDACGYIKKDAAIKHGHLIEAKKAATQACTLLRTDASLLTPPLISTRVMDPSIKLLDVPKVSANIPDDRVQHALSPVPHPKAWTSPKATEAVTSWRP
jgi:hypothetical protein